MGVRMAGRASRDPRPWGQSREDKGPNLNSGVDRDLDELKVGLSPLEQAKLLREWVEIGLHYSRRKRTSFRRASSVLKAATVVLSGASTVILGVQNLDFWAGLGFALVALVTVLAAIEPFFSWRSRWLLMEEQVYRFYRLRDDLIMAAAGRSQLTQQDVDSFYERYSTTWDQTSERWMEYRRASGSG
jgi:hypothetical protein